MASMKLEGKYAPIAGPVLGMLIYAQTEHWNFDKPEAYGICAMMGGIGLVAGLIIWFIDSRRKPAKEE